MAMDPLKIEAQISGLAEAQAKLDQLAEGEKRVGQAAQEQGEQSAQGHAAAAKGGEEHLGVLGRITGGFGKMAAAAAGFFVAMVGFQKLIQWGREYFEWLEKIKQAQDDLANSARKTEDQIEQLAVQLGDTSDEGVRKARSLALQVGAAGGLRDVGQAVQTAIALDVAFAAQGGLQKNMGMAGQLAGIAGALRTSPEEAAKLVEVLGTAGALQSPEDAKKAADKIFAAFTASRSTNFGAFAQMIQQGGTGMLTAGVPLEQVLEMAVRARQVTPNEAMAGTLMEQFMRTAMGSAGGEKAREFLGTEARKRDLSFATMTDADRMRFLERLFAEAKTPEEQAKLQEIVPSEVFGRARAMVAPETMVAGASAMDKVRAATGAALAQNVQSYLDSTRGRERRSEFDREIQKLQEADQYRLISQLRQEAETAYQQSLARGDVGLGIGNKPRFVEEYVRTRLIQEAEKSRLAAISIGEQSLADRAAGTGAEMNRIGRVALNMKSGDYAEDWIPTTSFDPIRGYWDTDLLSAAKAITVINYQIGTQINQGTKSSSASRPDDRPGGTNME